MGTDKYKTSVFVNQTMQILIEDVSTIWINVLKSIRKDNYIFNTAAIFLQDFEEIEGGPRVSCSLGKE